jgi:acyl-coenzyme A thioesterase PaaI-like protein
MSGRQTGRFELLSAPSLDYQELTPTSQTRTHNMKHSVAELPFNSFLGIEMASDPAHVLRLPAGAQYLNHLGTVHASALLALAEASSGEFLLRAFGSASGVVPVVRRLEAKFRKPANGAITSTVSTPPAALEQVRADLAAKGRAIVSVAVELHDESGAHTLSATVEWFITRISDAPAGG